MKHEGYTPGPWRTGDLFRTVFGPSNGNPSPETIATVSSANGMMRFNARLIADAPRLAEENERLRALLRRVLDSPVVSAPGKYAEVRDLDKDIRAALAGRETKG